MSWLLPVRRRNNHWWQMACRCRSLVGFRLNKVVIVRRAWSPNQLIGSHHVNFIIRLISPRHYSYSSSVLAAFPPLRPILGGLICLISSLVRWLAACFGGRPVKWDVVGLAWNAFGPGVVSSILLPARPKYTSICNSPITFTFLVWYQRLFEG